MNKNLENISAAMAYEAPQVEIIEVAVEKGYAQSSDVEEGGVNATTSTMPWH